MMTKSQNFKTGNQNPTFKTSPAYEFSKFEDCKKICEIGGLFLLPWQTIVLKDWLGISNNRWSARAAGLPLARQNGKTLGTTSPRMTTGALLWNEEVLYTAHLQKTSTETFEIMASFLDAKPFRKHLAVIKTALGREQIVFKNGGRIKFLARTRNGGKGQHGSLLVFDEAQELTPAQQASFLPALAAQKNPQTIYTGTPPDDPSIGEVFRRLRAQAHDGSSNLCWHEWSVEEIGDVKDSERWYMTNPSLGYLINEETVLDECTQMQENRFATERLGWWPPEVIEEKKETVLDLKEWTACEIDNPPLSGLMTCGVKFSSDGSRGCLAVCLVPDNGLPYVEVIDVVNTTDGVGWLASWLNKRANSIASVVIDGKSFSAALDSKLINLPKSAHRIASYSDVAFSNSMFVDAVRSGEVTHFGQEPLNEAATTCTKRKIGTDGFGFEDTQSADSTLIEACALAFREALITKRRPGKKCRAY